jgi:oxygen-independent coproporphyrinogen-3 oxidase
LASPDPGLSLYIHVPFCTEKCLYCDFYSVPSRTVSGPDQETVVGETISQARFLLESAGADHPVRTVFFGGGTPSVLPRRLFERLLAAFSAAGCAEWTVEANPETLDGDFLSLCRDAGVTRISLGIQSLNPGHLQALQRRATRADALSAIRLLQSRWSGEVNLDFITGIPGQTLADVREELGVLEGPWPGHVSLYQLTLEPGTGLAALVNAGDIAMNRPEMDEELWFGGGDELEMRGYHRYEVSNFCLPGRECRHNLRYWRLDPYLGAGPGAVSTIPAAWMIPALRDAGRPIPRTKVARLSTSKDIRGFLAGRDRLWGMEEEPVTTRDFLLETLMMGLRLSQGIPVEALRARFGMDFVDLFPGLWERWMREGFAEPSVDRLRLSRGGLDVLDHLLGDVVDALPAVDDDSLHLSWP